MKLVIETSPEIDAALNAERLAANVGKGKEEPPPLDDYAAQDLMAFLEAKVASVKAATREELKKQIEQADDAKIEAVKAALESASAEASPAIRESPQPL